VDGGSISFGCALDTRLSADAASDDFVLNFLIFLILPQWPVHAIADIERRMLVHARM
jgi:hypothetical protein